MFFVGSKYRLSFVFSQGAAPLLPTYVSKTDVLEDILQSTSLTNWLIVVVVFGISGLGALRLCRELNFIATIGALFH